ncbi:MAG: radical SAM protein [Brevinematia bacterium]
MMKHNTSVIYKLFKKNPDKALHLAQAFLSVEKAREIDYKNPAGTSNELPLITFKITPLCNLHCVMCGQRGVKGTLKEDKAVEEVRTIVPMEKYMELTDEVAHKTQVFYIWGGEPFLYPDFMDLASYMVKRIPIFTVNTNGTLLAKYARRIVEDQWSGFFISLDGFKDINDAIRGEGSYQRVIDGIEAINREKKLQKSVLPHMGIVTTVSRLNYLYLDKLVEATREIGLSWHIINLGTYTTEKIGEKEEEIFKKELGVEAYYWRGFATGYNEGIDGNRFSEILERIHNMDVDHPVITVPVIRPSKIGTYYSELETLVRDRCIAPWYSVDINYNGDVHFCADYPHYIIGNIKKESILDIYNNEKAVKFRKVLRNSKNGVFPACSRCYQLMLCGHRVRGY